MKILRLFIFGIISLSAQTTQLDYGNLINQSDEFSNLRQESYNGISIHRSYDERSEYYINGFNTGVILSNARI